jgi:threonylcarbamoyladenosine tRNA methylthiotransferase CDKAL1
MKVFVEGHGCSANLAETEQIKGFLKEKKAQLTNNPAEAQYLILNTCGVKHQTETTMLKRTRELNTISKKNGSTVIVSGCLPNISSAPITTISPSIIQTGTDLKPIAAAMGFAPQSYAPSLKQVRYNDYVSIIPISHGCLSACTFCGTKRARGHLKSYSIEAITAKVSQGLQEGIKEFWLTSQDNGCYGYDNKKTIVDLAQSILRKKEDFRLRIGMASPQYVQDYFFDLMKVFEDERVYRFLHLPVQSGSNSVLKNMQRKYTVEYYAELIDRIRSHYPDMTFSTDIIVGFPKETEADFQSTLDMLKTIRHDVVNISRYGIRTGTVAAKMNEQVEGTEKKARSRITTEICSQITKENNARYAGREETIFVTEQGSKGGYVGRTRAYKPVVIDQDRRGQFVRVKIEEAFPTYLKGRVILD